MRRLIVFYSRTGATRKVAFELWKALDCDSEEIIDLKDRKGVSGYISAGRDATLKQLTEIKEIAKNPADYDLVIIGTPVWAYTMSAAVRTYLTNNKSKLKKVAFFCTMQNMGDKRTFANMRDLAWKEPKAVLSLKSSEILNDSYKEKVKDFVKKLR